MSRQWVENFSNHPIHSILQYIIDGTVYEYSKLETEEAFEVRTIRKFSIKVKSALYIIDPYILSPSVFDDLENHLTSQVLERVISFQTEKICNCCEMRERLGNKNRVRSQLYYRLHGK